MDNVLNYIFESYDVMKKNSFWDYIKVFIKEVGVALHFIDSIIHQFKLTENQPVR